jgi:hypothetical protein
MANPKQRKNSSTSAQETAPDTGSQSIHGDDRDYGDRVAQRAYELYLARGAGDGRDFDDWLTAEREVTNGRDRQGDLSE